jgi:hypothetical protein
MHTIRARRRRAARLQRLGVTSVTLCGVVAEEAAWDARRADARAGARAKSRLAAGFEIR